MIIDTYGTFADDTDAFGAAGTALIGDVVDLGLANQNPGSGQQVYLVIEVTEAFDEGTVTFVLATDAQAAIATDGSATEHLRTGAVLQPAVGRRFVLTLPAGVNTERYMGILAVRSGTTSTTGEINAYTTVNADTWRAYAEAVN